MRIEVRGRVPEAADCGRSAALFYRFLKASVRPSRQSPRHTIRLLSRVRVASVASKDQEYFRQPGSRIGTPCRQQRHRSRRPGNSCAIGRTSAGGAVLPRTFVRKSVVAGPDERIPVGHTLRELRISVARSRLCRLLQPTVPGRSTRSGCRGNIHFGGHCTRRRTGISAGVSGGGATGRGLLGAQAIHRLAPRRGFGGIVVDHRCFCSGYPAGSSDGWTCLRASLAVSRRMAGELSGAYRQPERCDK